jgi:Type IV secretion system pilin
VAMLNLLVHIGSASISPGNLPHVDTGNGSGTIPTMISVVLGIAGALAVLMIVLSGLRYITAAGNPERISKAKNGIIYSLVGLAVAITAEAIVAFVANRL